MPAHIHEKHLEHCFIERLNDQGIATERQVKCSGGRCDVLQPGEIVWEVKRGHLTRETLEIAVLQARRYADAFGIDRIGVVCNSCDPTFLGVETFELVTIPMEEVEEWWAVNHPPDLERYRYLATRVDFLRIGLRKEVLTPTEKLEYFDKSRQLKEMIEYIEFWKGVTDRLLDK